jgi:hypothetical protein
MTLHPCLAMGPVYDRLRGFIPAWALVTALGAAAAWLALRHVEPDLAGASPSWTDRLARRLYAPLKLQHDWLWLAGGVGLLLLATDWQGFTRGFFRWDDFAYIQDVRENGSLPKLLNQYHNDHIQPLFRLWVAGVMAGAGPTATAAQLARAFNAVNFLTCFGVLAGGSVLLAAVSARRITVLFFCLFAWIWPGWGEFTTGFYTLIVYPQTLVAGLLSVILLLRFLRGGSVAWLGSSLLGALLAAGLDVSGMWVFLAIPGFAWALGGWRNPAVRRLAPWLLLAFGLAAYYHLAWARHPFAGRELVQNPTAQVLNHSLLDNLRHYPGRFPLMFATGLGATLLTSFIPGWAGIVAPHFSGRWLASAPFYGVEILTFTIIGWLGWRLARRLAESDRRLLVAFVLPAVVLIGMTVAARIHTFVTPGIFWPTKYLCVPQVWWVLTAAFLMERSLLGSAATMRTNARWIVGTMLAGIWLLASQWYLERALDITPGWHPAGRQGNAAAAELRRAEYASFQQGLEELSRRTGQNQLEVPPPAGLYWAYPRLEFGYDPVQGGTYLFPDLLSIAPATGLRLRERPRSEIAPQTLRLIDELPALRRVFDPTPPPR